MAGIAVALAFAGWADTAGVTGKLLGALHDVGTDANAIRSVMAATIGAVIGAGVSGLLAKSID